MGLNEVNYLKTTVSVDSLYGKTLTEAQIKEVKELAEGGFTKDELAQITTMGIDTAPLLANFQESTTKETKDISAIVKELQTKYAATAGGSDPYTSNNPQLIAFQKALKDGVIADLGKTYSKNEIVNIINQVFPSVGISLNDDGSYNCPIGHDATAKEVYNQFVKDLKSASGYTEQIQALQTQLSSLNSQIISNNNQIEALKGTVEQLQKEIEKQIDAAIEQSEEIADEQKKDASKIVSEELDRYTRAEGSMTYDDFKGHLSNRLNSLSASGDTKLSQVINKMVDAENKMGTLKGYLDKMGTLIKANTNLASNASKLSDQVNDLVEKEKESAAKDDENCKRCDPIGFSQGGNRYDFFVDKDKNGDLSNENEFLGAKNGWNEMAALDANSDGKVSKDELAASDLKMVVTDSSGKQTVKNAADVFKDGDSINLNSYDAVNKDMSNGNTLLGTYSLTFNGDNVDNGYNTLDNVDWLRNNYNFSDRDNGINDFAKDKNTAAKATDFSKVYSEFENNYTNLEKKLETAWSNLGITRSDVKNAIQTIGKYEGKDKAKDIESNFKEIALKKQEEKKKTEQT
ncbi:MAG: hypothetical protein PHV37_02885 [Candidatus Gastranaerophilales bacterium]|nr:hypothetical protein [Candidatus Gastranaerophilales bacterium]